MESCKAKRSGLFQRLKSVAFLPFTIVCSIIVPIFVVALAQSTNGQFAPQPNAVGSQAVRVNSVAKVYISKEIQANLISYSYEFASLRTVYIRGLGVVPAKGAFSYLSREQELEFRHAPYDSLIARVPLEETIVTAAKPPFNEIPAENQFPVAGRTYVWDLDASLQERANLVLAKYFIYLPRDDNKVTYFVTTYTPMQLDRRLADKGIIAQLALLLSFPYGSSTKNYSFRVQRLIREGRSLSDELRSTSNPDVIRAADDFIEKIVAEMKRRG